MRNIRKADANLARHEFPLSDTTTSSLLIRIRGAEQQVNPIVA